MRIMKKTNHEKNIRFHLIFRQEPEGGFTVFAPSLPGCITYGKNLVEAKRMAADAIHGYLASLRKHNEAIPSDDNTFISSIDFALRGTRGVKALLHV